MIALAIAAIAAVSAFGVWALISTRARGQADAETAKLTEQGKAKDERIAALTQTAAEEKERADALDDLLAHAAVSGPVDGAFDRLLETWRTARRPKAAAVEQMPDDAGATGGPSDSPGSDDLMRPGA